MSIDTRIQGPITIITIARPEALNSLDVPAMRALRAALERFRDDEESLVAIVTGEGTRAFCTGADLKNTMPPTTSFAEAFFETSEVAINRGMYTRAISLDDLRIPKPIIAAVNGHCLGGGLEIALACDLRIGSTSATFGLPEARWASTPAIGGLTRLMRAIPSAVAMRMLLTAERIDAEEAYRVGLISDLVSPEELLTTAVSLAERIAGNGPLAVRAIKKAAAQAMNLAMSESIAQEQALWGILRDTRDRSEGREAFAERRPPEFLGR